MFKDPKATNQFKNTVTINKITMNHIEGIDIVYDNNNIKIYFDEILMIFIKIDDIKKYSRRIDILHNCIISDNMEDLK